MLKLSICGYDIIPAMYHIYKLFSVILEDLKLKCFHIRVWVELKKWSHRCCVVWWQYIHHCARNFTYFRNSYGHETNDWKNLHFRSWLCYEWFAADAGKPVKWKRLNRRCSIFVTLHEYLKKFIATPNYELYLFLRFCMNFSSVISSKRTKSNTPTSDSRIVMVAAMYVCGRRLWTFSMQNYFFRFQ